MEEHFKAAKAFTAGIERSHDESVQLFPAFFKVTLTNSALCFIQAKRTLRMLYNEQLKEGRDLQRRIEKLKEEGRDPLQPQPTNKAHPPTTANIQPRNTIVPSQRTTNHPPHVPGRIESPQPLQRMTDTVDESFMLLGGQRVSEKIPPIFTILAFSLHHTFTPSFIHFYFFVLRMILVRTRRSFQSVLEYNARNARYPFFTCRIRNCTSR